MSQTTAGADETRIVLAIPPGLVQFKHNVSFSFAVGVLLFFLPFLSIRCNDVKITNATGIDLATGFKIAPGDEWKKLGKGLFDDKESKMPEKDTGNDTNSIQPGTSARSSKKDKDIGPNYFMMAIIAAGIVGLATSLLPFKEKWMVCTAAGWLGVALFVLGAFYIMDRTSDFRVDLGVIQLSVNFTFWFFLSVLSFIAAAVFSQKHRQREWSLEKQKEIDAFIQESAYPQHPPAAGDTGEKN